MPTKHTTGLHPEQYTSLLTLISTTIIWNPPATRARKLTLADALTMTLMYLRFNHTDTQNIT